MDMLIKVNDVSSPLFQIFDMRRERNKREHPENREGERGGGGN